MSEKEEALAARSRRGRRRRVGENRRGDELPEVSRHREPGWRRSGRRRPPSRKRLGRRHGSGPGRRLTGDGAFAQCSNAEVVVDEKPQGSRPPTCTQMPSMPAI
ncbi:hypothetical protein OPAG_05022 [Rhodococcus opacus PD630]|nr:hypothetical protein OPAG_05022 [Rhodococcus opacus PD630]